MGPRMAGVPASYVDFKATVSKRAKPRRKFCGSHDSSGHLQIGYGDLFCRAQSCRGLAEKWKCNKWWAALHVNIHREYIATLNGSNDADSAFTMRTEELGPISALRLLYTSHM